MEEGDDSSSSEKDDAKSSSSSAAILEGARAAELTDLQKNYELKLFDQTVYLSTGSKQGVLALRIPDELWVVTYTDFADGVVSFKKDNAGLQYSETDAVKKIIGKMDAGFKISFVVKEADNADEDDIILYSVDGGDYSEAVKASVAVQKSKVSKAETIQKKIYECADGDSTRTFKFFVRYPALHVADAPVTRRGCIAFDVHLFCGYRQHDYLTGGRVHGLHD